MPKETSLLLSWSFDAILSELSTTPVIDQDQETQDKEVDVDEIKLESKKLSLPLNISNLQIFGS